MAKDELDWTADPFHTRFETRTDGSVLLEPQGVLPEYPARLMDWLEHWASAAPERTLVARRAHGSDWNNVSYCEVLDRVHRVAAGLARRNLSEQRPILIMSGNSIEHLVLSFAAMWVGIPFCPMSPAYSLASADLCRARYVVELLTPGLIAAFDTPSFARTLMRVVARDIEIIGDAALPDREVTTLKALEAPITSELDIRHRNTDRDTITKFLLTSGSTGQPKVVITTNRMVCSNGMMQRQSMPFLADEPPVVVDWLPWSHTFGGSHILGLVLSNGGTLYIDDGKPTPAGIAETIRNLREISPTVYFNVPKGFEMLAQHLREDEELRKRFYRRLRAYFFAGASLAQHTWDALDAMSLHESHLKTPMLSGLGATETGPAVTFTTPAMGRAGVVGLPANGSLVKLAPVDEKFEIRARSPSITPGYWRQPALTATAFDDEGFYRLGDAVRLLDQNDPTRGLVFDGRISEDFKLSTGSWVSVGPLRAELIAQLAPFVQDVVIARPDADYITGLLVPDVVACARALGLSHTPSHEEIARDAVIKDKLQACLRAHARRNPANTRHIRRAHLLPSAPSLDHGEITDKGSINQRAVLRYRAQLVAGLYVSIRLADVIDINEP